MRKGLLAIVVGAVIAGIAMLIESAQPSTAAEARPVEAKHSARSTFEIEGLVTNTAPFLDAVNLLGRDGFRPVALKVADDAVIVDKDGATLSLSAVQRGAEVRAVYELRDNYFLARSIAVLQAPAGSRSVPGFGP